MQVYGQLQNAGLEVLSSSPSSAVQGRIWFDSATLKTMIDDGTNKSALLRNDQKCVFGTNGTANSNIRLNRAAAGVLQLVLGGDVTAEGTLSASIAQLSSRVENYTVAGAPASASANKGRLYYATDVNTLFVDNGSTWQAVGTGGGGGALAWYEGANSPVISLNSSNIQVADFAAGLAQTEYVLIQVPSTYVAGTPISLRCAWVSPDSSGNVLMQTVATLIRSATDAYTSTTNQRTSTNAAVTTGAGTVNKPQVVTFDLTSSTGTINSVAVSANDFILVALSRGTDTATSDVSALIYAAGVTFA